MLQLSIIGNLGADAEKKEKNGKQFFTFSVAHSEKLQDGTEKTVWVSCISSHNISALLPFLTKGTRVYVLGRASVRVFSSPATHQFEAGIDLSVERIEFCGQPINRESVKAWLEKNPETANEIYNELPF